MSVPGMGKANYGTKKVTNFKMKDGDNGPYRIFPAMNEHAADGMWSNFRKLHWGYKGLDARNPAAEPRIVVFQCPKVEDYNTKTVLTPCAKCNEVEEKKQLLAARIDEMKAAGKSKEEIKTFIKPLMDWIQRFNLDSKHDIFVMNQAQEFGVISIPHKMKKALDAKIKKLSERKIDATDPSQGVWFVLTRTGTGNDTTHTVDWVTDDLDDGTSKLRMAPLSEDLCARAVAAFPKDITKLNVRLTSSQVEQLVKSNGSPEEVSAIFGLTTRESSPSANRPSPPPEAYEDEVGPEKAKAEVEPVKAKPAPTLDQQLNVAPPTSEVDAEEIELLRKLAEKKAAKEAAAKALKAASTPTPIPAKASPRPAAAPAADPLSLADEDFLSMFKD